MEQRQGRSPERGGVEADLARCLPVWGKLAEEERRTLASSASFRNVEPGAMVHSGGGDCLGLGNRSGGRPGSKRFSVGIFPCD